jgi:hypothetical protein
LFGFSKFWESLSEGIASKWVERLFSPALAFWGAALAAYCIRFGPADVSDYVERLNNSGRIVLLLGVLVLVVSSAAVLESLEPAFLRLLEGYWPDMAEADRVKRTAAWRERYEQLNARWRQLARRFNHLSDVERYEYRKLDRDLALFPEDPGRIMPTRLGNVMVAAELHCQRRYGLAAALMWSRLWLILPDDVRKEVAAAQHAFNLRIRGCAWSLAIGLLGFIAPLFFAISLITTLWSYRQAVAAGSAFGQVVSAAYDLHARDLVRGFGMEPAPGDVLDPSIGRALTLFVRRGDRPIG